VLACVFTVSVIVSPLLSSVGEFAPASESFNAYFERLEQFFVANGISAGTPSGYRRGISSQGDDESSTTTINSTC